MELGAIVAGGDCIVRQAGQKTTFVAGGIPGEDVEISVYDDRKDLARATVAVVNKPSPLRINPPCPVQHKGCGGCQWQHIAFDAHADFKMGIVIDALTRIAKLEEPAVTFGGSIEPFGYRTTMKLPVVNGKASLHKLQSKETVTLDLCMIAHPLIEDLIINGDFKDATQVQLRASVATQQRVAWITGTQTQPDLPDGVIVTFNGRKAEINETVNGVSFRISARSFFQSGPQAAELIAASVLNHVPDKAELILDAYCGVGVLGGLAARQSKAQLFSIEQEGAAVNDAKDNLADIEAKIVLGEVAAIRPSDVYKPSVIIADPARSGLGPSASRALATLHSPRIILVSCDPASFARDAVLLNKYGYDLASTEVLDVFPQTHHVETVSVFNIR